MILGKYDYGKMMVGRTFLAINEVFSAFRHNVSVIVLLACLNGFFVLSIAHENSIWTLFTRSGNFAVFFHAAPRN
jgi:hypothetical protein